jgi:hypothetical protein
MVFLIYEHRQPTARSMRFPASQGEARMEVGISQ